MLTKKECNEALDGLRNLERYENFKKWNGQVAPQVKADVIGQLIREHFDNPPLKFEERVKILEKQLDIAIKDLCFTAKGADACNSLDDLYEGIREKIEEQARKEVQE